MSYFAVNKYADKKTLVQKKRIWNGQEQDHYFDTEEEANAFLIKRAQDLVAHLFAQLEKARKRADKCRKKYA